MLTKQFSLQYIAAWSQVYNGELIPYGGNLMLWILA